MQQLAMLLYFQYKINKCHFGKKDKNCGVVCMQLYIQSLKLIFYIFE